MATQSYIIIGSGVFGASTALYLIRTYPRADITLIDRDSFTAQYRVAASWDWNKVIRADYLSIVYTKLGLEAQALWRTDQIWKPFYHESGVMWISPSAFGEQVLKNFDELGVKVDIRGYEVGEARGLYGGLFEGADYTGVKQVLINKSSGWAEAKEALRSTIETAVGLGVKYVTAEVTALEFEGTRCCGVKTAKGDSIRGDRVLLCTGAFTPKLLVESTPEWKDLHAGDRIVAAAVTEAIAPLTAEQTPILDTMPVVCNDNPTEYGMKFEFVL
jgi:glycine/D-amino acid oxidase-like deaminating enzyme